MSSHVAVALSILLCCGSLPGAAESFTIEPKGAVGRIEVRYFLTGAFGGYGGFVRDADKDGAYRIPLEENGSPANSLRAILYAQGCQFTLVSVDLTTAPTRSAAFECRPLSTITLRGRISPPLSGAGALDVEINYLSPWDHKFFGISEGMIGQFSLGSTPLSAGGRFQLEMPDFSKDGVTNQVQDAYLEVLVVEHSTQNILEKVLPRADLQYRNMGLKILPGYDSEVAFSRQP